MLTSLPISSTLGGDATRHPRMATSTLVANLAFGTPLTSFVRCRIRTDGIVCGRRSSSNSRGRESGGVDGHLGGSRSISRRDQGPSLLRDASGQRRFWLPSPRRAFPPRSV
jgi:hypothetical protein